MRSVGPPGIAFAWTTGTLLLFVFVASIFYSTFGLDSFFDPLPPTSLMRQKLELRQQLDHQKVEKDEETKEEEEDDDDDVDVDDDVFVDERILEQERRVLKKKAQLEQTENQLLGHNGSPASQKDHETERKGDNLHSQVEKDEKERVEREKDEKEHEEMEKEIAVRMAPTSSQQMLTSTVRYLLEQTTCGRQSELFLTLIILYQLRDIERRMGEDRYLFYLGFALSCYSLLLLPSCAFWGLCGARGPSFLLFSSLYLYHQLFPALYQLSAAPWLSEKSFLYLLAAQLALFDGFRSLYSALLGLLTGAIYLAQFKRFRFRPLPPSAIRCCRFFFPLRPSR